jgi:hypothetical protein
MFHARRRPSNEPDTLAAADENPPVHGLVVCAFAVGLLVGRTIRNATTTPADPSALNADPRAVALSDALEPERQDQRRGRAYAAPARGAAWVGLTWLAGNAIALSLASLATHILNRDASRVAFYCLYVLATVAPAGVYLRWYRTRYVTTYLALGLFLANVCLLIGVDAGLDREQIQLLANSIVVCSIVALSFHWYVVRLRPFQLRDVAVADQLSLAVGACVGTITLARESLPAKPAGATTALVIGVVALLFGWLAWLVAAFSVRVPEILTREISIITNARPGVRILRTYLSMFLKTYEVPSTPIAIALAWISASLLLNLNGRTTLIFDGVTLAVIALLPLCAPRNESHRRSS